jgi:peptide deformylase
MAIRKVSNLGHPVLRQVAQEVASDKLESPELRQLIVDLCETMVEYEGVGLAAPQVFESVRVFVMYGGAEESEDPNPHPVVWVNPTLEFDSEVPVEGWEGCLSIPDLRGRVSRNESVWVSGFDRRGEARRVRYEGFSAVVAQHEFDHLNGVMFMDRMKDMKTLTFVREFDRYWQARDDEE